MNIEPTFESIFLRDIDAYEKNNLFLFPKEELQTKLQFERWREEVLSGHVKDESLRRWISNLVNYYGEKDRPFATYLEGLLK